MVVTWPPKLLLCKSIKWIPVNNIARIEHFQKLSILLLLLFSDSSMIFLSVVEIVSKLLLFWIIVFSSGLYFIESLSKSSRASVSCLDPCLGWGWSTVSQSWKQVRTSLQIIFEIIQFFTQWFAQTGVFWWIFVKLYNLHSHQIIINVVFNTLISLSLNQISIFGIEL